MKTASFLTFLCLAFVACSEQRPQNNQPVVNSVPAISKKKIIQREVLSEVDYNRVFENAIIDSLPVKRLEIGTLQIPTGKIVACDPLVLTSVTPFNKTVKPGIYPVTLYVAQMPKAGERNVVAKLEFSKRKAEKWVLALHDDEDTGQLKNPGDFFGFPVDAGMGGFLDYQAGLDYLKFTEKFDKEHPGGNIYSDYLEAEFKKNAIGNHNDGNWLNLKIPGYSSNITMFESGFGDGTYPAYWGMTNDNQIVSLIIDFLILPLNEKSNK